jgi:hypothetical protein
VGPAGQEARQRQEGGPEAPPFRWADAIVDAARAGITPDEFHAATLREISIRIEGALWRQEQAARRSLREAWYVAALMRQKRLPSLKKLLHDAGPQVPQDPDAVRQNVMAWAAAAGLKIRRRADAGGMNG